MIILQTIYVLGFTSISGIYRIFPFHISKLQVVMATKIIIAGGSVAGLALANMLERFGIDFVVLEAYPRIAPQVGASIGLLPNGLRILDQLGCYEASRAKSEELYQHGFYRGSDGEMIGYQHDLVWLLEKGCV